MTMGALTSPLATSSLKRSPALRPLAVAQPADARRQPLELDLLLRQAHPARQMLVLGEEFQDRCVGGVDVLGIAGERHPAERSLALAEERADVGRHEAGIAEGVLAAPLSKARWRRLLP